MADYKELLRRAIEALAENNGAARRTVYERARSALVEQLRAVDPPLPAREITQHRLKLEDCIRQVEQEATEALLHAKSPPPEPPPEPTRTAPPESSAEEQAERAVAEALGAEAPEAAAAPEPPAETERAVKPATKPAVQTAPKPAAEAEPAAPVAEAAEEETAAPARSDDEAEQIEGAPSGVQAEAEPQAELEPAAKSAAKPAEKPATPAAKAANGSGGSSGEGSGETAAGRSKPKGKRARPAPEPVEAAPQTETEAEPDTGPNSEAVEPDEEPVSIEQVIAAAQREAEGGEEAVTPSIKAAARPVVKPAARIEEPQRRRSWLRGPSDDRQPEVEADDAARQRALEASIGAAMSSVREVDVEAERPPTETKSAELDDGPQAAIDRAIAALDREVNGAADEAGDEVLAKGEPGREAGEEASAPDAAETMPEMDEPLDTDYWSEADAAQFEAGQREEFESAPLLEDEGAGRGGVTIFLVLVAVLMIAAGGGGYWAWQEGYLDLGGLMARVGLGGGSEEAVSEPLEPAQPATVVEDQVAAGNTEASGGSTDLPSDTAQPDDGAGIEGADKIDERLPAESTGPVVETAPATEPQVSPTAEPAPAQVSEATPAGTETEAATPPATAEPATEGEPAATTEPTEQALVDPALAEGSQSILLEEQGGGATGPAPFSGSVAWSREVDELGLPVIRARADIPARNLTVDLLIRKNSDEALPASHLMEINFSVLDSFVGGGIASLPGVLLKDEELAQGRPLVGASARVFDNSFLFALSAEPADLAANTTLLHDQAWVDLPMVYSTGRRAILTLEKGEEGQAIFDAVMDAWAAE